MNNKLTRVAPQSPIGKELRHWFGPDTDALQDITVNDLYTVYAVVIRENYPWYIIANDDYEDLKYPHMYASIFFDEVDNRVSSCWNVGFRGDAAKLERMKEVFITFTEWANDEMFFERLIDGNDHEVKLFQRYKMFMDMEFPSPSITDNAELMDGAWMMCSQCSEAWESESTLGMIRCPKCSVALLNPRYSPPPYSVSNESL